MSFAPKSLALKSLTNFAPNSPFLFCAERVSETRNRSLQHQLLLVLFKMLMTNLRESKKLCKLKRDFVGVLNFRGQKIRGQKY